MPDPIDIHVGSRVRLKRTMMGLSQEKLAVALDLTFQQVQKYERGSNRIGASRLVQIAAILDTSAGSFFEEMPEEITGFGRKGMSEDAEVYEVDRSYSRRETLELVRVFFRIEDETLRQKVYDLIVAIGEGEFHFNAAESLDS